MGGGYNERLSALETHFASPGRREELALEANVKRWRVSFFITIRKWPGCAPLPGIPWDGRRATTVHLQVGILTSSSTLLQCVAIVIDAREKDNSVPHPCPNLCTIEAVVDASEEGQLYLRIRPRCL